MSLITSTDALAAFCNRLAGADYITVDTEFMREKTYWPKLCLVQVAGPRPEDAVAIDPLADVDLSPLYAIFDDPAVVKVFHAARQDLEIFLHLMDRLPAPVFDTQVAAMVCGYGDQVSYETLVARVARANLDKGSRFTDWSLRPLSPRQIDYALADVTHLRKIYRTLSTKLDSNGRREWLAEEMASLTDPASYRVDPRDAFRRIKTRSGDGRFLAVLRELAAWRERHAQDRDVPRGWVLRDEALLEIAHHVPATTDELARTRGLARKFAESQSGQEILAAVARGRAVDAQDLPAAELRRELPKGIGPVAELLKVLLKMKSEEADVAQRLVASSDDVELIAALGDDAGVAALTGWRRQVFGEDALALRRGDVALAVRGRRINVVRLRNADADTGVSAAEPVVASPTGP